MELVWLVYGRLAALSGSSCVRVGSAGGQQGVRREFLRELYIIYINMREIE